MTKKKDHPKKEITSAGVAEQSIVAPGFHLLKIYAPGALVESEPGQFVMVRPAEGEAFFLPRPISIHSVYRSRGRFICELLYQVVGKGTLVLSRLKKGDRLLVQGPLGKGFRMPPAEKSPVLIAGGMGVAPIRYLAERLRKLRPEGEIICYQGARNRGTLLELKALREACGDLRLSTDDGSCGFGGTVTDLLAKDLTLLPEKNIILYACGPHAMLKSLYRLVSAGGIECQVSIEERMACGVGACLGCAVRDSAGAYRCVCKDGPVFDLEELAWNDGGS